MRNFSNIYSHFLRVQSFILVLGAMFVFGCSREKEFKVEPDYAVEESFYQRARDCQGVNLLDGLIEKENLESLFKCAKWRENYPSLYAALDKIPQDVWQELLAPVDKHLLSHPKRRNTFLVELRRLKEVEGVTDLYLLPKLFIENQGFSVLKKLFQPTQSQLAYPGIELLLSSRFDMLPRSFNLLKSLNKSFAANEAEIKESVRQVIDHPEYINAEVAVANSILDKYRKKNVDNVERYIIPHLLRTSDEKGANWLKSWLEGMDNDGRLFKKIFLHSSKSYPEVSDDFKYINGLIDNPRVCGGNEFMQKNFGFNQEISNSIAVLRDGSYSSALENLFESQAKLINCLSLCGGEATDLYRVINRTLRNTEEFFSEVDFYRLLKFLHKIPRVLNFPEKEQFKYDRFFMDYLASDFFQAIKLVSDVAVKHDANIFHGLYRLFRDLSFDGFDQFSIWVDSLFAPRNFKVMESYAHLWFSLSESEKSALFKVYNGHLLLKGNVPRLFDFYLRMGDSFFEARSDLQREYKGNWSRVSELSLKLLEVVDTEEVRQELVRFLSNKEYFLILDIIAETTRPHDTLGVVPDQSVAPLAASVRRFQVASPAIEDLSVPQDVEKAYRGCLQSLFNLTENGWDYYKVIRDFPSQCQKIKTSGFLSKLTLWLTAIDRDYIDFYSEYSVPGILSPDSLYSREIVEFLLNIVLSIEDHYGIYEGGKFVHKGYMDLLESVHQYMQRPGVIENTGKMTEAFAKFNKGLFDNLPEDHLELTNSFLDLSREEVQSSLFNLSHLIADYESYTPSESSAFTFETCEDPDLEDMNFDVCMEDKKFQDEVFRPTIKNFIKVVLRDENRESSMLEEIVNSMHKDARFEIPFHKPKRTVRHSLRDVFYFLYDLSDGNTSRKVNLFYQGEQRKEFRFNTIERLQILIRDIAFSGNFYGTYFKNTVAKAKNYRKTVKSMKLLMNGMTGANGVLSIIKYLESAKDKRRLKNANQTYPSLIHLSDEHSAGREHGTLTHSILNMLTKSSPKEVQGFNPLIAPDERAVEKGHNSYFLTDFTTVGGLSIASKFLRENLDSAGIEGLVRSHRFSQLNDHFVDNIPLTTIKDLIAQVNKTPEFYEGINRLLDRMVDYNLQDKEWMSSQSKSILLKSLYKMMIISTFLDAETNKLMVEAMTPLVLSAGPLVEQLIDAYERDPDALDKLLVKTHDFLSFLVDGLTVDDELEAELGYIQCASVADYKCMNRFKKSAMVSTAKEREAYELRVKELFRPMARALKSIGGKWNVGRFILKYLPTEIKPQLVDSLALVLVDLYEQFEEVESGSLQGGLEALSRIMGDNRVNYSAMHDWLVLSNTPEVDQKPNPYFAENTRLLIYLGSQNANYGKRNIEIGLEELLVTSYEDSLVFFDGLFKNISFVRPPYAVAD